MTNESSSNFFHEEDDLQQWAAEFGDNYEPGSQGTQGQQPIREMGDSRVSGFIGRITGQMRELGDLPAIADEDEVSLHLTKAQFSAMTVEEQAVWQDKALEWLIIHPNATINMLIDQEPSPEH